MIWRILIIAALVVAALIGAFLLWSHMASRGVETATLKAKYLEPEDRHVEAAGLEWRVREEGPAGAPVIVLAHGFQVSLESFEPWAEILSEDYRVVTFDLPGHGLTGPDPQRRYSNEQTVELTAALIDALGLDAFVIGGNSLGGLIAWRYAAEHPDKVRGLILISPGGYSINNVTDEPVEPPAPVVLYLRTAPRAGVTQALNAIYADDSKVTEAEVERMRDLMRGRGVGDALVERLEVFTLPDPEPDLARIEDPALILWGAQDVMVPAEHAARFESAIPDARAIVYDDLGHVPHEEAPARTAADARAFIESLSGESAS